MTTVVNIKSEKCDVYIGRPRRNTNVGHQHFGNPFSHLAYSSNTIKMKNREEAVEAFRLWLFGLQYKTINQEQRQWIIDNIHQLKDKKLGCWCHPLSCHGHILATISNNPI